MKNLKFSLLNAILVLTCISCAHQKYSEKTEVNQDLTTEVSQKVEGEVSEETKALSQLDNGTSEQNTNAAASTEPTEINSSEEKPASIEVDKELEIAEAQPDVIDQKEEKLDAAEAKTVAIANEELNQIQVPAVVEAPLEVATDVSNMVSPDETAALERTFNDSSAKSEEDKKKPILVASASNISPPSPDEEDKPKSKPVKHKDRKVHTVKAPQRNIAKEHDATVEIDAELDLVPLPQSKTPDLKGGPIEGKLKPLDMLSSPSAALVAPPEAKKEAKLASIEIAEFVEGHALLLIILGVSCLFIFVVISRRKKNSSYTTLG